jgi:hypothetical protein
MSRTPIGQRQTAENGHAGWIEGGDSDLWADLTWANRPDMTGSQAPSLLQDVWVATILAIQDVCGALGNGTCHLINVAAAPLVESALEEQVVVCAGYGAFVGHGARIEFGFRWRPDKWARWIDGAKAAHLDPEGDVHTWLETRSHVVDFSTGDTMGDVGHTWPPLIHWAKSRFPQHPREAWAGSILLWRNARAAATVTAHLAPIADIITHRAAEILSAPATGMSAKSVLHWPGT